VLLFTHEFIYNVICLPHFWYPQCDSPRLFHVPKTHRWFPLFNLMRSAGPGRCLIVFTGIIQCFNHDVINNVVLFSLSRNFLLQVWCYNNNYPTFYTFYFPSSRTFWLMALSVTL
jgi:hypothetical protein